MGNIEYRFVEGKQIAEFAKQEWTEFSKEKGYRWEEKIYYLAAFSDKDILGFAKFIINGGIGELKELIVRKDIRREKIGSKLMDMYEEYCCERECHMLKLRTAPKIMEEAFQLYKKKGFEVIAELKDERYHFDWVVMCKRLKA